MSRIHISIIGTKRVINKLNNLMQYQKSPILKKHYASANRNIRRYWASNVYKVFNRRERMGLPTSGALGRAYKVSSKDPQHVTIGMKPLSRSGNGVSGGPARDYGEIIMNGSRRGRGLYKRKYDLKFTNTFLTTPGVKKSYGNKWRRMLSERCKTVYRNASERTIKEILGK